MSDIQEMAKELNRAIELGDGRAATKIRQQLRAEIRRVGGYDDIFDLGAVVEKALKGENWAGSLQTAGLMGTAASVVDLGRGEYRGLGLSTAHEQGARAVHAAFP